MELSKEHSQASYQIQNYHSGMVTVNHKERACPIIVMPERIINWDIAGSLLTPEDLHIIADIHPDLVIIGTGPTHTRIPIETFLPLINAQIGFEVMSSASACRTYSILALEGRNVAAAFIC